MGIPVDVIFVTRFLSNRQFFFFNKIVAYQEWLNCMVTLRTSDLKNKKPCITMTKESVTVRFNQHNKNSEHTLL